MNTYFNKPEDIKRQWHVVDAADQTLGRLSSRIAHLLMGKHKPVFTPAQDVGDYVVVVNAARVRITGKKAIQKLYYRHSNYPGGFRSTTYEKMMDEHPTRLLEHAIYGMLPHTHLGARMRKRLRVYAGAEQPHQAAAKAKSETEKEVK